MRIVTGILLGASIFLTACTETYAPVVEVSTIEPLPKSNLYRVQDDDTLYSIAWRYGLDYRELAKINNIARPYHIEVGQMIRLRAGEQQAATHWTPVETQPVAPVKHIQKATKHVEPSEAAEEHEPTAPVSQWRWPASGPVIGQFSGSNKGVNIAGTLGQPVYATAAGKVVYSGDGLRAYGNLVIIKHNSAYLSAYAYNSKVLVNEGDWVKSGQKISEMGRAPGKHQVMLHFEIRHNGKPVNPLSYLPKK